MDMPPCVSGLFAWRRPVPSSILEGPRLRVVSRLVFAPGAPAKTSHGRAQSPPHSHTAETPHAVLRSGVRSRRGGL